MALVGHGHSADGVVVLEVGDVGARRQFGLRGGLVGNWVKSNVENYVITIVECPCIVLHCHVLLELVDFDSPV